MDKPSEFPPRDGDIKPSLLSGDAHSFLRTVRRAKFTGLLAIAYLTVGSISATAAMALNLACLFVSVMVGLVLLWRKLPSDLRAAVPSFETSRWIREAVPFALIAAAQTLMAQVDIVLVGTLAGATPAGLYAVATRGAALTLFGAAAMGITLAPTTAQLWTSNEQDRLQRVVTRAARLPSFFHWPWPSRCGYLGRSSSSCSARSSSRLTRRCPCWC